MAVKNAARPSARERLLAAADELFYEEGVHTVGIDRVIEHAGVAKGSLYNTFGSKDELIRAYLEGRHARMAQRITGRWSATTRPANACWACSRPRLNCSPSRDTAAAHSPGPAPNPTPATWSSRPPKATVPGSAPCSPAWPGKPASRTRRGWPASCICSTTEAGCPPGWTTTRRRRLRPAPPPRPCSTRPSTCPLPGARGRPGLTGRTGRRAAGSRAGNRGRGPASGRCVCCRRLMSGTGRRFPLKPPRGGLRFISRPPAHPRI